MRFFRRFSFRHRRTKSDTAALIPVISQITALARSHSVEELRDRARTQACPYYCNVLDAAICASARGNHPTPSAPLHSDPFDCERRIRTLEAQVEGLTRANHKWTLDYKQLQEQAKEDQRARFIAASNGASASRNASAAKAELVVLQEKLAHYERFLGLMISIGLHELVLDKAHDALRDGRSADEALVDAIKEAAAKPGSAWSGIMPAIVGPRPPEQYVAAINLTLKLRRELRDSRKIAKFWKLAAKENQEHVNLITPSASLLSDVNEPLSEERQRAVDDLMLQLRKGLRHHRSGSVPTTSKPKSGVASILSAPIISTLIAGSEEISGDQEGIPPPSNSITDIQTFPCTGFILPPLASESFRQEVASKGLGDGFFKRSSSRLSVKRVLGEVDINARPSSAVLPKSESVTTQGSKISAKALSKRRAMAITQSLESIAASIQSENMASLLCDVSGTSSDSTELFASTLTESLLKIRGNILSYDSDAPHRQRPDSVDSPSFDNSAFNALFNAISVSGEQEDKSTDVATKETSNAGCALGTISEEDIFRPLELDMILEVSQDGLSASLQTWVQEDTSTDSTGDTTLHDKDISFEEAVTSTAPTTPEKGQGKESRSSPEKTSRLPVLKQLRRMSPTKSIAAMARVLNLKPPSPLVIRKKGKAATSPLAPTKAPVDDKTPTDKLPTKLRVPAPSRIATLSRVAVKG